MPPLLDISISQLSADAIRGVTLHNGTFKLWKGMRCLSIPGNNQRKMNLAMAKAVTSLKPRCMTRSNDYYNFDSEKRKMEAVEHKEYLRRMRISDANKGKTPWNKGKKHNPETIQRIRESTRIAMLDPKVKVLRLKRPVQIHSEETKEKIREKVRAGWEKRREKLKVQSGCWIEWQNLIAEASRKGLAGEEELQWDSYKVLDQQFQQEWLESILIRKKLPRRKGCKRSPKSPEQRTKISVAINAKWADPEYRERVYSGLSRYHGKNIVVGNKRRRKSETRTKNEGLKAGNISSSQVKMMGEGGGRNKKDEAIARAKELIVEAQKAVARYGTSRATAELSRMIIDQAILSLQSINNLGVDE